MKLSTKGRYAVTAMMDLAIHDYEGPVTLADISNCQGISLSYLEQLFAKLRKSGLVEGVRGPGGGYRLGKPASQISIADIIAAVDETIDATRCKGNEDCHAGEKCLTHQLWTDLSKSLYEFLDGLTLASFINRPEVRAVARRQDTMASRIATMFPPRMAVSL
ncbi:Fe-S cluster assembly transcription factor [Thiothrix eikelboomii]|uniref:Transcriptional regulator, BadM/Rrf2 family n=1 Tax=Thiothrix eikelboomii TaxID=92487 RepID=A0A1T4WP81_9GAMM|nr:Fe-S cluster assembly transcription factor [Thiothrix eikelboomii]SKA78431.1 transcriptional regulator, BadM/Rrf2 family [Thiothrix eikelboomii]